MFKFLCIPLPRRRNAYFLCKAQWSLGICFWWTRKPLPHTEVHLRTLMLLIWSRPKCMRFFIKWIGDLEKIKIHLIHNYLKCSTDIIYFNFCQHLQKIAFYMEGWFIKILRSQIIHLTKIVSFLNCCISWHSSGHITQWCFSFNNILSFKAARAFLSSVSKLISEFLIWSPIAVYWMGRNLLVNIKPQDNCEQRDTKEEWHS